jgi:hypothetical protein
MNPSTRPSPRAPRRTAALAITAGLLASVWGLSAAPPVAAGIPPTTVIVVNTTDDLLDLDAATISLREAVNTAAGPDPSYEIVLAEEAEYVLDRCNGGTDELNNLGGDLDLNGDAYVTLRGNGATVRQTCDGERVLQTTNPGVYLEMFDTTITGGRTGSTGGGIWANGTVSVHGSTVEGNVSTGPNGGGGIAASLEAYVSGSVIRGNTAVGPGGGVRANELVHVNTSAISGNYTAGNGGGISSGTSAEVHNSTVTGNAALGGGGGISASDDVELAGDTVVANRAPAGANAASGENLILDGTIIALGADGPDCLSTSPVVQGGGSVGGDPSCGGPGADDLRDVHPQISLLTDEGRGATPAMAPVIGSPVVDRYPAACSNVDDQWDTSRPQGAACDSGSIESPPLECEPTFPDVGAGHDFFEEICWLSQTGITGGFADGTFKPGQDVSRQAMAAFLYRLALAPPPPATGPTFSDVPTDHAFSREIEWLNAQGISTGYPDGTFRPGDAVTRQAMAAFLHRVAGTPAVLVAAPTFSDVPEDHAFFGEIEWMAQSGVSTGFADGTFRPDQTVTRQAMAAFLQRLAADVVLNGL